METQKGFLELLLMEEILENNGINYLATGAGFLPSTVPYPKHVNLPAIM